MRKSRTIQTWNVPNERRSIFLRESLVEIDSNHSRFKTSEYFRRYQRTDETWEKHLKRKRIKIRKRETHIYEKNSKDETNSDDNSHTESDSTMKNKSTIMKKKLITRKKLKGDDDDDDDDENQLVYQASRIIQISTRTFEWRNDTYHRTHREERKQWEQSKNHLLLPQ